MSDESIDPSAGVLGDWRGRGWTVRVSEQGMAYDGRDASGHVPTEEAGAVTLHRRWLRWELRRDSTRLMRLPGLSGADANKLAAALRRAALAPVAAAAESWQRSVFARLQTARDEQRWIDRECVEELAASRPDRELDLAEHDADALAPDERAALAFLNTDLSVLVGTANEQIMAAEMKSQRQFLDTIEKTPLTDEQARAVLCFDNRVQVLAAAGSGKTSVMVARAAYAVARGFVAPERILLLAFNKAAAGELQERVQTRLAAAGIDSTGIRASTFHAFGLAVIGQATGAKPRLASWLDSGEDLRVVMQIVDELRDSDASFRRDWDLYRTVFAKASNDLDDGQPDGWDAATKQSGYRTFNGDVVKSHGERVIADWLYLNGVDYAYERPYDYDVATPEHSQYRPDFYYPEIDVWHEHWAIGLDGQPPKEFKGYAEGMEWKRRQHASFGTTLLESTWAEVLDGDGLARLEEELVSLGAELDWNPDRPTKDRWTTPMKHEDLARLVRTFMSHVKAGSQTPEQLEARLKAGGLGLASYRTRLFLSLYWPIHNAWQRRLAADDSIDFEDMLVGAAQHLESGEVEAPFDLVLVDEFQDASRARARLVRGLVNRPGRYLLAVGDDWQSINRFAGADMSVMTDFTSWFGAGPQLNLTTTFRCPQSICDVARAFVTRNPMQFDKPMRSSREGTGAPIRIITAEDCGRALQMLLTELSKDVAATAPNGSVRVDVLGRYRFERDLVPRRTPDNLKVTFRTIHGSKALEADYVVVPNMTTGLYGFPSAVEDDPVLALAMPAPDAYPDAEERRLLYVALTRARRQAILIAPMERISPFIIELFDNHGADGLLATTGSDGTRVEVCKGCGQGQMVQRAGRYGPFLGCSRFPACENKRSLPPPRCPGCGEGQLVPKSGRHGPFLGCTRFPDCKTTQAASQR